MTQQRRQFAASRHASTVGIMADIGMSMMDAFSDVRKAERQSSDFIPLDCSCEELIVRVDPDARRAELAAMIDSIQCNDVEYLAWIEADESSTTAICEIKKRRTWKHLNPEVHNGQPEAY